MKYDPTHDDLPESNRIYRHHPIEAYPMTARDINEAIAIACGWELKPRLFHNREWKDIPTWVQSEYYKGKPDDYCMAGQWIGQQPPNYCGDLNAMHEAEKTLGDFSMPMEAETKMAKYWDELAKFDTCCIHATASQRAEAFLRTIGKWKD